MTTLCFAFFAALIGSTAPAHALDVRAEAAEATQAAAAPQPAPQATEVRTLVVRPAAPAPSTQRATVVYPNAGGRVPGVRPVVGGARADRCAVQVQVPAGGRAIAAPGAQDGSCTWLVTVPGAQSLSLAFDAPAGAATVRSIRAVRADGLDLAAVGGVVQRGVRMEALPGTFVLQVDAVPAAAHSLYARVMVAPPQG